jgi:hypothetical protein
MLGKFFDKFCFNTIFLVLAVLVLGGFELSSVFKRDKGGHMTESSPVLPRTIGFWTRPDSPKVVTAENIFDYMNGAGELYLGYRFDHCEVYEYSAETQKEILVELYYMNSSDDAFGLLSLDWGGEPFDLNPASRDGDRADPVWPRALYGEGLLRLWSETIYARVMATQETPESKEAVLSIGRAIAIAGEPENFPPPILLKELQNSLLPNWTLCRDRVSFFRTYLVLNSLYYLSHQNILDLDLACEAVSALYETKESPGDKTRIRFLLVKYPDPKRAEEALTHFHEAFLPDHPLGTTTNLSGGITNIFPVEDGWMAYAYKEKSIAFVFECPDRETARAILDQMH